MLLAVPKFLDSLEESRLVHIKNDVKASESALQAQMLDNKKIDSYPIAEIESESSFYDTKGLKIETVGGVLYDVTGIVKSKLDGKFVANSEGEVYYVATDSKKYGWHITLKMNFTKETHV